MVETSYPSISVVVPSFNQGQYLEETILSVIGQQYPNLELIVIDGGSTDNSLEIIKKYSDHISYWHSRKDKGQGDAINQGMSVSSGNVVCWLNSDDMYLPGTLLDIGNRFKGRTEGCHLIYGGAIELSQSIGNVFSQVQPAEAFDAMKLTYWDLVVQPSSFWTRTLWKVTGDINVVYNYVLDWDWFIRASKFTSFEYVPRFYSIYRFHPLHKTGRGGIERRKEICNIVGKYSSDYWIDLYSEVQEKYDRMVKILKILHALKIPRRNVIFLPLFFPRLRLKLKKIQDFYMVLNMYQPDLYYLYKDILGKKAETGQKQ
jgi:glycosyltransferase involved in cell wall biosynthesis